MFSLITLGSLTASRRALATKMTEFVVDDSDSEVSNSDTESLGIRQEEILKAIRHLQKSEDSTDKRFLTLLKSKSGATVLKEEPILNNRPRYPRQFLFSAPNSSNLVEAKTIGDTTRQHAIPFPFDGVELTRPSPFDGFDDESLRYDVQDMSST